MILEKSVRAFAAQRVNIDADMATPSFGWNLSPFTRSDKVEMISFKLNMTSKKRDVRTRV